MVNDPWESFSGATSNTQTARQPSGSFGQGTHSQPGAGDDDDFGDDDWGDFEDASAANASAKSPNAPNSIPAAASSRKSPATLPPKPRQDEPPPQQDSKIGQHPFAGHMDFLFEPGDDEYDAGDDDLANLAKDPEAAMAFSKRIIAEQEARAKNNAIEQTIPSKNAVGSANVRSPSMMAEQEQRRKKLTKSAPTPAPQPRSQPPSSPNPPPARNKLRKKSGYAPAKDPNVLFDAENVSESEDDDDFGDFEGGTEPVITVAKPVEPKPQPPSSITPEMDLLGLDDNLKPITQIGRSRSDSLRKANEILGPTKKPGHSRNSSLIDDNPWDDFEPQKTAPAQSGAVNIGTPIPEDDAWDDFETAQPTSQPAPAQAPPIPIPAASRSRAISESTLPPTNIPPPAILLSVFPSIFSAAQDALFTPLSRLDNLQRQQLLAHPATHQFLQGYLGTAIVLARIIAGRKQRWKRDQILSQSMRIGQAGAGGRSGMKLTGVDKGEATKEEQEAQEAIRLWRAQAGKLRGAITTALSTSSSSTAKLPPIPEISEQMPVRTLKAVEGGFTAPHACALCGLKREERVAKVDVDVDDSFGEWWVQGVDMHLACRNWWDEHKGKLKSR